MNPLIKMTGIRKCFGHIIALDSVDFSSCRGQITALVGENGAGKSTLMKILYGMLKPDSGRIYIDGNEVHFRSPADAIKMRIGMVHQHFMLAGELSVIENIALGDERLSHTGLLDYRQISEEINQKGGSFTEGINLSEKVSELTVGIQQKIEIIKLLYRDADILILDEPTAILTPQEINALFENLTELKSRGKTIILITHKIREILAVSDRICVLKQGRLVADVATSETDINDISRLITGQDYFKSVHSVVPSRDNKILSVRELTIKDDRDVNVLENISFELNAGEILGIAGVEGNGQRELAESICGIRKSYTGHLIHYSGKPIAFIPSERTSEAIVPQFNLQENLILGRQRESRFSANLFWFNRNNISAFAKEIISDYNIYPNAPYMPISDFSGGNQQKAVAGREFTKDSDLIIAFHPTRGLDIGATGFIRQKIIDSADAGMAVILISSDLEELIELSSSIAVIYNKSISVFLSPGHTTEDEIGLYMNGLYGQDIR
jgi:ABC-type uncharacterized transport system ATPase subunit